MTHRDGREHNRSRLAGTRRREFGAGVNAQHRVFIWLQPQDSCVLREVQDFGELSEPISLLVEIRRYAVHVFFHGIEIELALEIILVNNAERFV